MLKGVNETLNVQVLGKMSIEDSLRLDNISIVELPEYSEDSFYVSAEVATFTIEQINKLENQSVKLIEDTQLISTMDNAD